VRSRQSEMEDQTGSKENPSALSGVTGIVPQSTEFVKESWQELKKVHWPTRKETYSATMIVVVVVLTMALFLGVVDFALTHAMRFILS
jgi:preprotein translocase subunit SecE